MPAPGCQRATAGCPEGFSRWTSGKGVTQEQNPQGQTEEAQGHKRGPGQDPRDCRTQKQDGRDGEKDLPQGHTRPSGWANRSANCWASSCAAARFSLARAAELSAVCCAVCATDPALAAAVASELACSAATLQASMAALT